MESVQAYRSTYQSRWLGHSKPEPGRLKQAIRATGRGKSTTCLVSHPRTGHPTPASRKVCLQYPASNDAVFVVHPTDHAVVDRCGAANEAMWRAYL